MKTLAILLATAIYVTTPVSEVAADKAPVIRHLDEHSTNCPADCWYKPPFTEKERARFFRIGGNVVLL